MPIRDVSLHAVTDDLGSAVSDCGLGLRVAGGWTEPAKEAPGFLSFLVATTHHSFGVTPNVGKLAVGMDRRQSDNGGTVLRPEQMRLTATWNGFRWGNRKWVSRSAVDARQLLN
jgi:hypothetical protein